MKIFEEIFNHSSLIEKPPILLDIGASGALYPHWKDFAKYSICVAFDPDSREMKQLHSSPTPYKEFYIQNSIVTADKKSECDFYLTKSPYCSSTLKPNIDDSWSISPLFEIEKKVILKAENLSDVLTKRGISKIDWFKTDSQGTDLQIFESLGEETLARALAADFEPGIISSYEEEDKTWEVLKFMDGRNFWMTGMRVLGAEKMPKRSRSLPINLLESLRGGTIASAGWTEMSYLNNGLSDKLELRDYLLLWIFSTVKNQHGFAYEIACMGKDRFNDNIFAKLAIETEKIAAARNKHKIRVTKILRAFNRVKKIFIRPL